MSWIYRQSTGELRLSGSGVSFNAYSGSGAGKNNPEMEAVSSVGPIPRGRYIIETPRDSANTGPYVLPLRPDGHNAHGRTFFQIHGENAATPAASSSGCIILSPRSSREEIWNSEDHMLQVIP